MREREEKQKAVGTNTKKHKNTAVTRDPAVFMGTHFPDHSTGAPDVVDLFVSHSTCQGMACGHCSSSQALKRLQPSLGFLHRCSRVCEEGSPNPKPHEQTATPIYCARAGHRGCSVMGAVAGTETKGATVVKVIKLAATSREEYSLEDSAATATNLPSQVNRSRVMARSPQQSSTYLLCRLGSRHPC